MTLPETLEEAELRALIAAFSPHLACWGTGLYYGSVVYFELGDKVEIEAQGNRELVGSANVALYGYDWWIYTSGKEIANSRTVTQAQAEEDLAGYFIDQRLADIRTGDRDLKLVIAFTGDLEIVLRPSQDPEFVDDLLATVLLPNGYIVGCNLDQGAKRLVFHAERYEHFE